MVHPLCLCLCFAVTWSVAKADSVSLTSDGTIGCMVLTLPSAEGDPLDRFLSRPLPEPSATTLLGASLTPSSIERRRRRDT